MSISPGYTDEEIRALVYEYERQPHGRKSAWLAERSIGRSRFVRWRLAVHEGDIERGLIPRESVRVSGQPSERARAATRDAAREQRIAELEDQVQRLQEANEALGKAIGLLHKLSEQEPGEPAPKTPPGKPSSTPSTNS